MEKVWTPDPRKDKRGKKGEKVFYSTRMMRGKEPPWKTETLSSFSPTNLKRVHHLVPFLSLSLSRSLAHSVLSFNCKGHTTSYCNTHQPNVSPMLLCRSFPFSWFIYYSIFFPIVFSCQASCIHKSHRRPGEPDRKSFEDA